MTEAAAGGESGEVIVLTGPPGAGKTTVARLLADRLSPSVHPHGDDFWRFIRQGRVEPYLREAQRQNEIVIDVIARAAFGYAAGGYPVVGDGIFGPWFIDRFRAVFPATATGILRGIERGAYRLAAETVPSDTRRVPAPDTRVPGSER